MGTLVYRGKIRFYLQAPFYMIIVFLIGNAFIYKKDFHLGMAITAAIVFYAVFTHLFYIHNKKRLGEEIINFALHYGTVQKQLLAGFALPYALLDASGRLVWMNDSFARITDKDKTYHKSVSTIFKEITKESIDKMEKDEFSVRLNYEERTYNAHLTKLHFDDVIEDGDLIAVRDGGNQLTALILFDITELEEIRTKSAQEKMVPAYIYIDNYEETVETVEDVKRSLLQAVIDRQINQYFQEYDAIVRKPEKDKYFVIFQQQYLEAMEENKFSLLEDIKSVKVGNENEVTLSIGIGVNGENYTQSAEYARAAINIALGRGGSQAVIKNNQDVAYYGIRGREVEKSTRVKARVKAQALQEMIQTRDNVIVMGHSISDVDSFGAAIGVYCAARAMGKKTQIVLNTITSFLRPVVDVFTEENGYPADLIITSEQAMSAITSRTLLMVVDTNRASYTECPELLDAGRSIVVFDHHRQGRDVIPNPLLSYIEPYASSTCEMIAEVLQYFSEKVQLQPIESDCIYAGILIDTNNFMVKTGVRTFEAAAYLRRCGADVTRVRKILRENMETYKARAEIVRDAEVYRSAFAISVCTSDDVESPTVVGAQAANELLNIVGIKASFVLTNFRNKIYVSSRSLDELDVQLIMERLGGGGHLNVAGAQIENTTIDDVKQRIKDIIDIMLEEGEITL